MIIASTMISCNGNKEKEQQSLAEISKQELATALSERDQLLSLVKEVSAGLNEIKQLENIMTITASQPAENPSQKTQILSDIASLKEKIGVLNNTVDSLNTTVSTVTDERNTAQEASVRLENELNTCYYVVARKSELKDHNIIESGFLRKTKLMKGDFDKGFFVISDKRTLTTLPLNTEKAKILTNHPASSYEVAEENGMKVIRITNPDQFWSLTNYLVVQKD